MNNGRVGARLGPSAFRAALSIYGANDPDLPRVFDAGDVDCCDDIHETHRRVTAAVDAIVKLGLFPVGIGGGHDLTFPFVRAVTQNVEATSGPFRGVYLDAHLDVRAEVGSGMPFRRLVEDCGVGSLTCIGADPFANSPEHIEWFTHRGGSIEYAADVERAWRDAALPACFAPEQGGPMFVSIDMDCLSVAHAPGVSAINPAGLSPQTVGAYAFHAGRCPRVRCFDLMELNPNYDVDNQTARLAAHLFLQFLRGFSQRQRN